MTHSPDRPFVRPTDVRRDPPHARAVDQAGLVWAHPNPLYLYRWIARRDDLLRTIVAMQRARRRSAPDAAPDRNPIARVSGSRCVS